MLCHWCNIKHGVTFLSIIVGIIFIVLMFPQVEARTITVDDSGNEDFIFIQDGIDTAEPGDSIRVYDGIYYENLVIDKPISIIGNGSALTTIRPPNSPIIIISEWVNISNVKIIRRGINIESNHNTISSNSFESCGIGIHLRSDINTISSNSFESCGNGIGLKSNLNTISNNSFESCHYGIFFNPPYPYLLHGNHVINNDFVNNDNGLYFDCNYGWKEHGEVNLIVSNNFYSCKYHGIYTGKSWHNKFLNNNMVGCGFGYLGFLYWWDIGFDSSNVVNGLPFVFMYNQSGFDIIDNSGQILLFNCSNFNISDQSIHNASTGILLTLCDNFSIHNNHIEYCTQGSLFLSGCADYRVYNNTLYRCSRFNIDQSYSTRGILYHNNIIGVKPYYRGLSKTCYMYNPTLLEGNYWNLYNGRDDGSGNGKHSIAGDGIGDTKIPFPLTNGDYYPLINEVQWENSKPVISINDTYVAHEGEHVHFYVGNSFDADNDPLDFRWDFDGDGSWDTDWSPETIITYSWGDDYSGIIFVEISDGKLSDTGVTTITVNNVAPSVEAGRDLVSDTDETIEFSGSYADPGWLDTHIVEWNFGDGHIATGILNPMHEYEEEGEYSVTLTVIDDDGGVGRDTLSVSVYEFDWHPPMKEKRTFKAGSTIPIKFSLSQYGEFIHDEGVQVSVIDTDGNIIFHTVYGHGDDHVRIDSKGKHYITNWHTDKEITGEFTIRISFSNLLRVEKTIELI